MISVVFSDKSRGAEDHIGHGTGTSSVIPQAESGLPRMWPSRLCSDETCIVCGAFMVWGEATLPGAPFRISGGDEEVI
jgi:hypothetical protein